MNPSWGNAFRIVGVCSVLSVLLSACLAHTPAPVSERSLVDGPMPDVYTVQNTTTLYSVEWGRTRRQRVGRPNRIEPPYLRVKRVNASRWRGWRPPRTRGRPRWIGPIAASRGRFPPSTGKPAGGMFLAPVPPPVAKIPTHSIPSPFWKSRRHQYPSPWKPGGGVQADREPPDTHPITRAADIPSPADARQARRADPTPIQTARPNAP